MWNDFMTLQLEGSWRAVGGQLEGSWRAVGGQFDSGHIWDEFRTYLGQV